MDDKHHTGCHAPSSQSSPKRSESRPVGLHSCRSVLTVWSVATGVNFVVRWSFLWRRLPNPGGMLIPSQPSGEACGIRRSVPKNFFSREIKCVIITRRTLKTEYGNCQMHKFCNNMASCDFSLLAPCTSGFAEVNEGKGLSKLRRMSFRTVSGAKYTYKYAGNCKTKGYNGIK